MTNTTENEIDIRYKENPFANRDWAYQLESRKQRKKVSINMMGKSNPVAIVDYDTGEIRGTAVNTYRFVDPDKFVKVFADNIGLTFDLTAAGIKAFSVLLYVVQSSIQQDEVLLDKYVLEKFCTKHEKKLSHITFLRGLRELCEAKILAKSIRKGWYWINPNFVFNGDRISFNTVLIKKSNEDLQAMHQQEQISSIEQLSTESTED